MNPAEYSMRATLGSTHGKYLLPVIPYRLHPSTSQLTTFVFVHFEGGNTTSTSGTTSTVGFRFAKSTISRVRFEPESERMVDRYILFVEKVSCLSIE